MNFNVYLDSALGLALKRLARHKRTTRNALIRKAVERLLSEESHSGEWSAAVRKWQGDPTFETFESHRTQLRQPVQDPFA